MVGLEDKLLNVILETEKISEADVEKVRHLQKETHERVDRILLNLGIISEEDLRDSFGELFNLPVWEMKRGEKFEAIEFLPITFLSSNRILPLKQYNGSVDIVLADPTDRSLIELIETSTEKRLKIFVGCEKDIITAIEEVYSAEVGEEVAYGLDSEVADDLEKLKDLALEAPVVRLVNNILNKALEIGSSDIHIEMFENQPRLRYRLDGVLRDYAPPTRDLYFATVNRIKIMSNLNIAEKRLPQDGRIRLKVGGREIDVRVSVIPMLYGEGIVLRILDKSNVSLDLVKLGFEGVILKNLRNLIKKPEGMILVTGPTGSGKTTTLYASLKEIISPELKVVTIEDPVEYSIEGVNQIQVNHKINLSFAAGLRSILRHDPDVILVGEIRDKDTASISIQSALTGHLVLSTLHTNDCASTFGRLLDMGVEDYLISTCVIAVLAQRLLRKLCDCKIEHPMDSDTKMRIGVSEECTIYKANGCDECGNTGYSGRVAVSELLVVNDAIRKLIINHESSNIIEQEAIKHGMRTFWDDGVSKMAKGVTTLSELERVIEK
ncbi:MAG: GspE/PulE family protein [Candidatus Scalindua sp. AMX11]|nr:MAG: GspE/PulE family protein [Candidatus Scalindua sp.]NOG82522.1 Flp pilus assembly complex ATPase component TadA [Planctomycetota bacterium]RZV93952.1 MAG: GspE/PulE family protein [Candidatus Scalindua sp. SCAELEC01]TDE65572.1 MAG: GspE/PulE family protein [Candidatus Scalindua sp. AMX11]GJQ58157.1 MAG: type II secretion system protein E [Candidatus Scalindua sp.]